jgi:two-component system nitrogen regulation response regulator GlnG
VQPPVTLIGETPAMLEVYKMIGRLATNSATALILGEHGTGKGLVVATIHGNSARRDRPLTHLACASVSESELDTALFGPGAGTVEVAGVHLLAPALQAKLAQALAAERTPSGGSRLMARVIATTDRDLADETAAGTFSRELYDEIAVIVLRLPPLRDRRDDIPLLVQHFIQRFNAELNRSIRGVDDQVGRLMQAHAWPGNLAELERVIKRAAIVTRSDVITVHDIGESLSDSRFPGRPDVESALERAVRASLQERLVHADGAAPSAFHEIVDAVESTLVREALAITNGNQVKAADILGVNRATLRKKMPEA